MGATKKIIQHFTKKPEEKKTAPVNKTLHAVPDAQQEKMEFERFKKLLSEKIKDPKMAKKAAMIISEMLNKSKK